MNIYLSVPKGYPMAKIHAIEGTLHNHHCDRFTGGKYHPSIVTNADTMISLLRDVEGPIIVGRGQYDEMNRAALSNMNPKCIYIHEDRMMFSLYEIEDAQKLTGDKTWQNYAEFELTFLGDYDREGLNKYYNEY